MSEGPPNTGRVRFCDNVPWLYSFAPSWFSLNRIGKSLGEVGFFFLVLFSYPFLEAVSHFGAQAVLEFPV